MISRVSLRRYLLAVMITLTLFALAAGAYQVRAAAMATMSENAVPMPDISGDGVIERVFDGWWLSALRSVAGKLFPYIALVLELLLWFFFILLSAFA